MADPAPIPELELYEMRAGLAHKLDPCGQDPELFLKTTGHIYPRGNEVAIVGTKRVAIFAKGTPRAWPLGGEAVTQPHAFTEEDVKSSFGSYMVYRLREVLTPDEDGGWPMWAIVLLVALGVLLVVLGVVGYFAYESYDMLREAL